MKLDKWTALWLVVVVTLGIVLGFELAGILTFEDLVANPVLFLVAFAAVAVLSAVGAMFIGVFVTHRIFATSEFTPFEREMLAMREEVREIRKRVEALARRAGDEEGHD